VSTHVQIVGVEDCILRVVYEWDADQEMVGDIVSVDLEQGNVASIMDDAVYEDMIDEIYTLHDDELSDT
jgi:uncharacterized membrane protein